MQNVQFETGIPVLTKHGIGSVIVFPPVDRNNQVWITGAKGNFTVMHSAEAAGLGNVAKNAMLDSLISYCLCRFPAGRRLIGLALNRQNGNK